ncbi:hypothetical protein VSR69_40905 [Paraburkholderia phytofirmans]
MSIAISYFHGDECAGVPHSVITTALNVGRSNAGGNTHHDPSSCRKKNIV